MIIHKNEIIAISINIINTDMIQVNKILFYAMDWFKISSRKLEEKQ